MSDKLRDGFEAWATDGGWLDLRIGDDGFYMDNETYCAFEAWKASRAALVVELPELKSFNASDEPDFAYEVAIDDIKCALDDAGVGYK